jgi:hypothetical protein
MKTLIVWLLMVFGSALGALGQQQAKPTSDDDKNKKQQDSGTSSQDPKPLFGGKIPARSSQNTKESASLGFNGIDPSGKVGKQMLAANAKPGDAEKVRAMAAARPAPELVAAFVKEGGLKSK